MLDSIVITAINGVSTVPLGRGARNEIKNRIQYGLSLCDGDGCIIYRHDGREYISDRLHALWLPMGATYRLECRASGYFPLINFHCEKPPFEGFLSLPIQNIEELLRGYDAVKEQFLFRHSHAGAMSALYGMLAALSAAEAEEHKATRLLAPAMEYLEGHYADPDLKNESLAAHAHISEVYFRRLFKEQYHTTPRQYILDLRMRHAKELLTHSPLSVGEVAELCGFSSVYHFCRAFSQATGQTPTAYRRRFGDIGI